MLFNLSVYFKYTCLAHHPDINYSNALREGRTILAFYESNTREFEYPSMEKLLSYETQQSRSYFCNLQVNFNGLSMTFSEHYEQYRHSYINEYVRCSELRDILCNKYKKLNFQLWHFFNCYTYSMA